MRYSELVELYEKLDSTTKRLEKTKHLADALRKASSSELDKVILLVQGRVFPEWEKEKKLGFSESYVIKALQRVTGASEQRVKELWAELGDLGLVAERLMKSRRQSVLFSKELSVEKVFENLRKVAEVQGASSVERKVQLVAELLSAATPLEARYITRTVLETLRIGIGSGTLRDALVWAFLGEDLGVELVDGELTLVDRARYAEAVEQVQSAYDKLNDFGEVALLLRQGLSALREVKVRVGKPLKVMLAQSVDGMGEGFERVGVPADVEYKYDGFRMQIHKDNGKVRIFTRRLEDVTEQFPEVVKLVSELEGDGFILDGEAVGFDPGTKKYLPFQNISQRIKRKYDIEEMSEKMPVELNVFDILCFNYESVIDKPFKERRALVEKLVKEQPFRIRPAHNIVTSSLEEAEAFLEEARKAGMEGVMLKNLDAPYKPGSRVGYMVKLKFSMETLDLVIVGAEWGEGKRSGWLTSYLLACNDQGSFKTIGRVGTGVKELEGLTFEKLTELLKPLIVEQKGRLVSLKPELVVEVKFNEIQRSPSYSSGYALRFPRIVRLRLDKGPDEASSLSDVELLFSKQL